MSFSNNRKYLFSYSALLAAFGIILILIAGLINIKTEKPILELSKQDTALNINNDILIFMSAGNKRLLTDLLWIQTLLESDIEHYQQKDLNNWLFLRFNAIALLDPKFYENYLFGGQYLAIIKDDLEGAAILYKQGTSVFPDDYYLNYHAGFLTFYEMGDLKQGIEYLSKIVDHPKSPTFIRSILNKILVSSGTKLEDVFKLVLHNYETTKDHSLKEKLLADLYAIKAEIDLVCLNNNSKNCDQKDLDGQFYLKRNNEFYSQKQFRPFRIKIREGTGSPLAIPLIDTLK